MDLAIVMMVGASVELVHLQQVLQLRDILALHVKVPALLVHL